MYAPYLKLLFATLLATGQIAASGISADGSVHGLLRARQSTISSSDIPSSCQSQCSVIENNTCTQPSCLCTEDMNKGMQSCINCILTSSGTPDPQIADSIQLSLTSFEDACKQAGYSLSSLAVTGVDGATATLPGFSAATGATGSASTTPSSPTGSSGPAVKNGGLPAFNVVSGFVLGGIVGGALLVFGF